MSATPTDELVALGLGSCIGLALVDRAAGVAGLAHIVLPESHEASDQIGKFANTAVPELISRMRRAGATERRLEAAMVGGARMFEMSSGLDIGSRNEEAVRVALLTARIPLRASETGGSQGRTIKVAVGEGRVSVRDAGETPRTLLEARSHPTHADPPARPRRTGSLTGGAVRGTFTPSRAGVRR